MQQSDGRFLSGKAWRCLLPLLFVLTGFLLEVRPSHAETINWGTHSSVNLRSGSTDTSTFGALPTILTVPTTGSFSGSFDGAGPNTLAVEPTSSSNGTTGYINSTINASVDNETSFHTTTINFGEPVYNVSVVVGDIDGGPTFSMSGSAFNDIVEFRGVNSGGTTVMPTSGTPVNSSIVTWNSGTGRALSTNQNVTNNQGDVTVTFAGPLRTLTIRHIAGANSTTTNPTQQFIYIESVTFTRSPQLTIQKTSQGGTGTFSFSRSNLLNTATTPWSAQTASTSITTATAGTAVTGTPVLLFAVNTAVTITETPPTNWYISTTPATCTDSNSAVSGNAASFTAAVSGNVATLAAANVRAGAIITCSIVNSLQPRLTLVKTVTNDNGGTQAISAWTLTATGPSSLSGSSGSSAVTNVSVPIGTYALGESGPAGYAMGTWSCTAGTLSGSNLTLSAGQVATCTVNNNDTGPVLTLVKTISGDGTPSGVSSFTLSATGPVTISGTTGSASITSATVSAGAYTLAESGPAGYAAGNWSCTAGSLSGSSLTLALGQTATCTINNTKLPTLTLRKISNGGTGTFSFSGTNGVTAQNIVTTSSGVAVNGSTMTLTAASTSTQITETLPGSAWEIQTHSCTGMGSGGTASRSGNTITLDAAATAAGSNIICTVTNRRLPMVAVQKITSGTTGGPFSFSATNVTGSFANITTSAAGVATPASPTPLVVTTTGTAVSITESFGLAFVSSGAVCTDSNSAVTGNSNPVATSAGAALNIPGAALVIGANITCVFTNAAAAPQLSLSKNASLASVSSVGQSITYTLGVSNPGNVTLTNVTLSDALGSVTCPSSGSNVIASLAPGASTSCTFAYAATQADFDSNGGGDGDIDNTANATTTYNGSAVSAGASASVALLASRGLDIVKLASGPSPVNTGNVITYRFRVQNTGNQTLTNVHVSDVTNGYGTTPIPGSETLFSDAVPLGDSSDGGANGSWDTLRPNDIVEFTASYTVTQQDFDLHQ